MANKKNNSSEKRERVFATIIYPDSAPSDWLQILDSFHVMYYLSPLHDKDLLPDGSQKKPHYHLMLIFEGVKNFDSQIQPLFDQIGAVGREKILSPRGYARYLCHLDNPEKFQYSPLDVRSSGGLNYQEYISLSSDNVKSIREMIYFLRTHDIYSYAAFLDWCAENNDSWFYSLCTGSTFVIKEYLKTLYWENHNNHNSSLQ